MPYSVIRFYDDGIKGLSSELPGLLELQCNQYNVVKDLPSRRLLLFEMDGKKKFIFLPFCFDVVASGSLLRQPLQSNNKVNC